MQNAVEFVKDLLRYQLQLGDAADRLSPDSQLVESIAGFDSMSVVALLTAIEEQLGIEIDDEEVSGELFATLGSLSAFVAEKMA